MSQTRVSGVIETIVGAIETATASLRRPSVSFRQIMGHTNMPSKIKKFNDDESILTRPKKSIQKVFARTSGTCEMKQWT